MSAEQIDAEAAAAAAEKKAAKQRVLRLVMYVNSGKSRQDEVFVTNPCLGLHFGFGNAEIIRLQNAVARHGRQDQFENLTVPVDILLRMLSFIPNERDPRVVKRLQENETDPKFFLFQKTLQRLSATCSTLLFTINENKCMLGAKKPPEEDVKNARTALSKFREEERKARLAAAKKHSNETEEKEHHLPSRFSKKSNPWAKRV